MRYLDMDIVATQYLLAYCPREQSEQPPFHTILSSVIWRVRSGDGECIKIILNPAA